MESAQRAGMSRHHEHLNFTAETLEPSSGFYREAGVFIHAFFRS
jgi:hypothetical protein